MKCILIAVAVALLANVAVADYCAGYNITMNPGLKATVGAAVGTSLDQVCPYGFVSDAGQGRCLTYRQLVNNFYMAPCYTDFDCGSSSLSASYALPGFSGQVLKCGAKKVCTWVQTRAQNDTCDDNLNCADYVGRDASGNLFSVDNNCDIDGTKTCQPVKNVTVSTGGRCGYVSGISNYVCDAQNWCFNFTYQTTTTTLKGAGICMPLTQLNQPCTGKLNCAGGLVCTGSGAAVNYTCQALQAIGGACYLTGRTFECDQSAQPAYCNGITKVCSAYNNVGGNCTSNTAGNYLQTGAEQCSMGNRCLYDTSALRYKCFGPGTYNDTMGCSIPDSSSFKNCSTGLTCVNIPTLGGRCITGAANDPCTSSGGATNNYKDTCQWEPSATTTSTGLYCNVSVGATSGNGNCLPRVAVGGACLYLQQCQQGLFCYNSTVCKAYQTLGQACNNLDINPLEYLPCTPGLLCSRGQCINNYTVSIGGLCSQDMDCDTGYCDPVVTRCSQRMLCAQNSDCPSTSKCLCSSGAENMGQCVLNNCGKQQRDLLACLNPLLFDRYYAKWGSYVLSLSSNYALLDSQSSFYSKCSSQHSDWVRCQGLMNKWGAPSVALGDLLNYDLATISASSSVSVSIMVLVAFIMSAFMYL